MKYELEQSKKILVDKTGVDPIAFAYPYDASNTATHAPAVGKWTPAPTKLSDVLRPGQLVRGRIVSVPAGGKP